VLAAREVEIALAKDAAEAEVVAEKNRAMVRETEVDHGAVEELMV
jgi:hypothetical protein